MNKPEGGWVSMIGAIIAETPKLEGGSCKSPFFDLRWWDADARPHDRAQAKKICDACPVRQECLDWAMSDRSEIVAGTIGGVFLAPPAERESPTQRGGSCGHESGCQDAHYARGLCHRHYRQAENAKKRERRAAARGLEGEQRSQRAAVAS